MKVFEVLKGSKAYEIIQSIHTWTIPFNDDRKIKELGEMLGFDVSDILIECAEELTLIPYGIPKKLLKEFEQDEFLSEMGWVTPRKDSYLDKIFLEFCNKYNIKYYEPVDFDNEVSIDDYMTGFPRVGNRYFVTYRKELPDNHSELLSMKKYGVLGDVEDQNIIDIIKQRYEEYDKHKKRQNKQHLKLIK